MGVGRWIGARFVGQAFYSLHIFNETPIFFRKTKFELKEY